MRWPVLISGVLAMLSSVADAAPKRKVKVETDPAGATVYLNAKEDGPVCTTPCTLEAPVGETPIIVELENHRQVFENLVVSSKKSVSTVRYKLEPAIGVINVKGPDGAKITIDDVDKGKAPQKISVNAGPHNVVITIGTKKTTEFVDVASNDEIVVEGKPAVAEVRTVEDPDDIADTDSNTTDVSTTKVGDPPAKPRGPIITIAAAMDVGFRSFTYDNATTPNLTPETEGGQVLVGPYIEVWPGTLARIHFLRGLSILVRFGYGVNAQQVKERMSGTATNTTTFWRAFEASLRHRWTLAKMATLEVGGGFVRDQYQFEGNIDLVPDADYRSVRFGVRASALVGAIEPYVTVENRLVLSGGTIENRFDDASATGLRATAGAEARFGAINVRLEGALNRYAWTFKTTSASPKYVADGGTDSIKYVTASVGYAY